MAKGYWIAHVDVSDPEGYKEYQVANAVAFQKYGSNSWHAPAFRTARGEAAITPCNHRVQRLLHCARLLPFTGICCRKGKTNGQKGKSDMDLAVVEGYDGVRPG